MAFKKTSRTTLAAALATTFFAAASLTAQAAEPSANSTMSPTGSGMNSNMGTNAPAPTMPDRAGTAPMPGNSATGDATAGKRMHHHRSAGTSGMSGSADRASSYGSGATGSMAAEGESTSMRGGRHHSRHGDYADRRRGDPNGDRAVTALNTLMAAGYESFSDFRADGRNFTAYATRGGATTRVTIDPESRSVMPNG